jgi:ABC-type siderophore export system fused ATPase/permease subunit
VVAIATSLFLIQQSAGIRRRARADIDRLMELFRGHAVGIKELQLNASRRTDFLHELADTAASYNRQQVRVTVAGSSVSVVFSLQFMIAIGVFR